MRRKLLPIPGKSVQQEKSKNAERDRNGPTDSHRVRTFSQQVIHDSSIVLVGVRLDEVFDGRRAGSVMRTRPTRCDAFVLLVLQIYGRERPN
jgi:hypothetical protein